MPRKIDYSLWLEPPGRDEEYDIPAVTRELDEKLPEVLRKWPDIRIERSRFPSGLPRIEILLRVSSREDSLQALEAAFGIARDLGGWEIHDEQTSWTVNEEDRQALLADIDRELQDSARQRMETWVHLALVPLIIGFCVLSLGALAGIVSGWLFLAVVLGLIVLGVFVKRRNPFWPEKET